MDDRQLLPRQHFCALTLGYTYNPWLHSHGSHNNHHQQLDMTASRNRRWLGQATAHAAPVLTVHLYLILLQWLTTITHHGCHIQVLMPSLVHHDGVGSSHCGVSAVCCRCSSRACSTACPTASSAIDLCCNSLSFSDLEKYLDLTVYSFSPSSPSGRNIIGSVPMRQTIACPCPPLMPAFMNASRETLAGGTY